MKKFNHINWIVTLILINSINVTAQFSSKNFKNQSFNLVPNPSFEVFDTCPNLSYFSGGTIKNAIPWFQPYLPQSSTDYFNSCDTSSNFLGVPSNAFGYQIPRTGIGYSGIVGCGIMNSYYREYLEVELVDTLRIGKKYCVSFFVNNGNFTTYSISTLGIYFSSSIVIYNSPSWGQLSLIPQVVNSFNNVISDTLNWIEISGEFISNGGEKYIVIGNFNADSNSNYTISNFGNQPFAYYYIDDISVYLCDSTVGLNEENISELVLYPNPSRDIVKLKARNNTLLNGRVNVSNTLGGIMFKDDLSSVAELEIDISKWSNGIYYFTFESVYGSIRRMKLVKSE